MATAFLGHVWTRPGTAILVVPGHQTEIELVDLEYRGESLKSPLYYGYRLSWIPRMRRWMAIEGEFIHAKVFAETDRVGRVRGVLRGAPLDASLPLSSVVQRLAMSHGLNFILGNFAVRRGLGAADASGASRVDAVLRIGAGPTLPHAESTIDDVSREQYESGGLAAQVGGGLEVTVWRGLRLLGEYKFTWATPRLHVPGGEAEIPARSHHLLTGLAYRF